MSNGESENWEFNNDNFQRNQPDLLCLVSRKKGGENTDDKLGVVDMGNLIQEIAAIKRHQLTISSDLKTIQRDNQVLWTESMAVRDRYQRQQETIDKILRFLASVFSNKKKPVAANKKRRLLLGETKPKPETIDSDGDEIDQPQVDQGVYSSAIRASFLHAELF